MFGFFSSVGAINDIKLIRDKNTRRSKGIAYIEYSSVESAINALTLNGQIFMGMGVMVKPSEAEKVQAPQGAKKLHEGRHVHFPVTSEHCNTHPACMCGSTQCV